MSDLDFLCNNGGTPWLPQRTIFLTKHGSQAYGTNIATSDTDYKGICIPPVEYYLGFNKRFEQAECHEPDAVVFGIHKFFKLAVDCNPNVIEMLYTDPSDHLLITPQGEILLTYRDAFLSKKAKHTFSGYAVSQLKRIQGHYRWLKNPPLKQPERSDFGLPDERSLMPKEKREAIEAAIKKQVDSWQLDLTGLDPAARMQVLGGIDNYLFQLNMSAEYATGQSPLYLAAAKQIGLDDRTMEILAAEKRYQTALKEWKAYQTWKANRNEARAALEAKYGYDCKHAMHLVRLMRMCREILEGKGVIVRRPDREELLAIRNGAWTYEQLMEWATKQEAELEELYKTSPLPHTPDRQRLDDLCCRLTEGTFEVEGGCSTSRLHLLNRTLHRL